MRLPLSDISPHAHVAAHVGQWETSRCTSLRGFRPIGYELRVIKNRLGCLTGESGCKCFSRALQCTALLHCGPAPPDRSSAAPLASLRKSWCSAPPRHSKPDPEEPSTVGATGTPCAMSLRFSLGPCGWSEVLGLGAGACAVQVETISSLSKVKQPTYPSMRSVCGAPEFMSESGLRAHHPRLAPAAKEHHSASNA